MLTATRVVRIRIGSDSLAENPQTEWGLPPMKIGQLAADSGPLAQPGGKSATAIGGGADVGRGRSEETETMVQQLTQALHLSSVPEIEVGPGEFPKSGTALAKLVYLLRYAVRAPSSHNSQPWLYRADGDALLLYADRTRTLPVVDPDDRELVISCGAALFYLRVAIRHFGYDDRVELLPDPDEPDLLARIELGEAHAPRYDENLLFWATAKWRTNRHAFAPRPVPQDLLAVLEDAAAAEGALLTILDAESERHTLAELISEADRRQFADRRFRRELAKWVHPSRSRAHDGMPAYALELPAVLSPVAPLALRTFDVGKAVAAHEHKLVDHAPALLVLGTAADTTRDWLAAGQALAHVLLRAAQDEVSASFLNQPVEIPELRPRIADLAGGRGVPQLVLRMGYGAEIRPTPRRAVGEVLMLEEENRSRANRQNEGHDVGDPEAPARTGARSRGDAGPEPR